MWYLTTCNFFITLSVPGLNRIAKKLNIDCAPAMTGFDFNGGWTHPVFEGFVVCKEFEEIIKEAWVEVLFLFYTTSR